MALVDQYGYPVSSRQLFAGNRNDPARPRWPVNLRDTKDDIPAPDWQTVVNASRKLYGNYGVLKGAVHQKALHSVGRAWMPHFIGTDRKFGDAAKQWLVDEWYGVCDVRGSGFDFRTSLYLDSIALDRDGDFFVLLTKTESGYPSLQHIPAHRVGIRDRRPNFKDDKSVVEKGKWKGYRIEQGIILNEFNRPVAYRILGETEDDDRDEDSANILHAFDPEYPDQIRGLPAFSHAINDIRDAMQSQAWEQHAMLMASSLGLIEHNETGAADPNDPGTILGETTSGSETFTTQTFEGGMVRYFKAGTGGKLEQFQNMRPGDDWDKFQDRIIRGALLGVNWPYSLCWKSEGLTGTAERSEIEKARAAILDRQEVLLTVALREIRYAVAKAQKLGVLPQSSDWWKWSFNFPPQFSIDHGKDGNHQREQFKLGMLNMHQILGFQGTDYETHQAEREMEIVDVINRTKKIAEATGTPFDIVLQFFQQRSPNPPVQSAAPADQQQQSAP